MREIKFRAWDKISLKMYNDVQYGIEYCESIRSFGYVLDRAEPEKRARFILMQYTGLKDKNGKEIYEGDIVKYRSHPRKAIIGEVIYSDNRAQFLVKSNHYVSSTGRETWDYDSFGTQNYLEVIGNIHENPELIQKTK